jgi:LacI family transcriptional regulator, galactose operon repressor
MTTVSRALGDAPDISEATKKRVRKIAQDVGYVPNRAGVRLRTGKTNVISLVLATERDTLNMTSSLISAISDGLQGTPYHLVMIPEPPGQNPLQAIRNIVENRSADAIIFNRISPQDARVAYLRERNFPFVTHGRSDWSADHSFFDFDNTAFGDLAVRELVKRGRRRILLLAPPLDQSYARDIIEGATMAAKDCGVSLVLADQITSDSGKDAILSGLADMLNAQPTYDALISASPNSTMLATRAVEATGRRIGSDFDIFTKETVPFLQLFRPEILALREDVVKAGAFLAKAAIHEITKRDQSLMQRIDQPTKIAVSGS